jgi:hypothetical protein
MVRGSVGAAEVEGEAKPALAAECVYRFLPPAA